MDTALEKGEKIKNKRDVFEQWTQDNIGPLPAQEMPRRIVKFILETN